MPGCLLDGSLRYHDERAAVVSRFCFARLAWGGFVSGHAHDEAAAALRKYLTHWIRLMPTAERDRMQAEAFAALDRLTVPLPCGHPATAATTSPEGTGYCGWCADIQGKDRGDAGGVRVEASEPSGPLRPVTFADRLVVAEIAGEGLDNFPNDPRLYRLVDAVRCCGEFPECTHVLAWVDAIDGYVPAEVSGGTTETAPSDDTMIESFDHSGDDRCPVVVGTAPEMPSFRERLLAEMPTNLVPDFWALCAWEDEMLAFCNEMASRLDALSAPQTVSGGPTIVLGEGARDAVTRYGDALETLAGAQVSRGTPQTAQPSLQDPGLREPLIDHRALHQSALRERDVWRARAETAERSVGLLEEALRAIAEPLTWPAPRDFNFTKWAQDVARAALAGVETGPGKDEQADSGSAGGAVVEPGRDV